MKKILCPVDSTPVTDRLVQYISGIARDTESKIYLVSVQASKKESILAGSHGSANSRLDELHDYLSGIGHLPCGIEEEQVADHSYKKLGLIADRYDIMAMAIVNSNSNKISANGLDLIKVLQETLAPILLVPDRFKYQKINRLLYAYDYKHEPEPPLLQLTWLAEWFDVGVKFITILESDISSAERARITELQNKIKASWKGSREISFESKVGANVSKSLEQYLNIWQSTDLLVLSINHHNMLERIWHKSVVKGLLHEALHPYLIIHK